MPEENGSPAILTFVPRAVPEAAEPPAEADLDLLRRIAGGSEEALAAFYDRYSGLVWGLLRRMLGEGGEAEEVLQEAFLQVWRDARRYDSNRATPRGWLLLIARSRALDRLRKRAAVQRREEAITREEAARAVAPLGSRRLEHRESRERIHSALERLPREQRRVIELAFFHGLSQTEIAAHLGAPLGTVKSRALLGMKRLRQIFAAEGEMGLPLASQA
ncbi:MAG TPA: sigma-70 family RNA polymerase sigma factor [Thermoanaerobaculia bacterium]|jgi:RNA polymerase sigma-70 factor (ECF subfamily)